MNIRKLTDKFFFDKDTNSPDINNYGKYRLGLTRDEVKDYIAVRAHQFSIKYNKKLQQSYDEVAGANTCAVVGRVNIYAYGIVLHYRHDVERYTAALLENKPTYFD